MIRDNAVENYFYYWGVIQDRSYGTKDVLVREFFVVG
jgi:hypothetical protein